MSRGDDNEASKVTFATSVLPSTIGSSRPSLRGDVACNIQRSPLIRLRNSVAGGTKAGEAGRSFTLDAVGGHAAAGFYFSPLSSPQFGRMALVTCST